MNKLTIIHNMHTRFLLRSIAIDQLGIRMLCHSL